MHLPARFSMLLTAGLFSCAVVLPFLISHPGSRGYALEMELATDAHGSAQIFYDLGSGIREKDSARVSVRPGNKTSLLRFALPPGTVQALRFDPIDQPAKVSFRAARIVDASDQVVHRFAAEDFRIYQQVESLHVDGDTVRIVTTPHADDPILRLELAAPLTLPDEAAWWQIQHYARWPFAGLGFALLTISLLPTRLGRSAKAATNRYWARALARPSLAVALMAAAAVTLSNYPVIFLGKSFVSPNFNDGTYLLYDDFPTLPGYVDNVTVNAKGSDVGAIIWQQVPYSFIQHRALLGDGELPLWNRYNSCGSVLLGQGQTMFGDPLHVPVILANGASWAWDLKYLIAKWLLCLGLGLVVLRFTQHLPAAALAALAGAFLGFFSFRLNHPAFFSFCYAPWILFCWAGIAEAVTRRRLALWCASLIAANACELHSGTVKEAYMLLFGMNLSGLFVLLFSARPRRERLVALAAASWAGVLFILLTAPTWLTLKDSMKQAYSAYNLPTAFQIHPSVALGFFDELFYRPLIDDNRVFNPSANFLVLVGVLYFMAAFRHSASRPAWALVWSALLPAALAFGLLPPQWIIRVPILANVAHLDNCFSCVLIILAVVIAGFGWKAAFERLGLAEGRGDLARAAGWFALLVFPWIALTHTVHRPIYGIAETFTFLHWGERLPVSGFVWGSLLALTLAMMALLFTLRRSLVQRRLDASGALWLTLALLTLLWRQGWHAPGIAPPDYAFAPALRADFHAPSPAIAALIADRREPARAMGFGSNLFGGWSSNYDLEGIGGADGLANPYYRELVDHLGLERIWDWRLYLSVEHLAKSKPALDFLNVRYYAGLHTHPAELSALLTPVVMADLDVYRSETAWPRAFFADHVLPYDNVEQLAAKIGPSGAPPFAAIFRRDLSSLPPTIPISSDDAGATVIRPAHDYRLTTNTTEFSVEASGPGLAVLQEAWLSKNFQATLNGEPSVIVRVNHAFKGVPIPVAGTYRVAITYRPRRFSLALGLAAGGWILCLASGVLAWRHQTVPLLRARP